MSQLFAVTAASKSGFNALTMIPSSPSRAYVLVALVVLSVALFACGRSQPAAAATPFTYVAIGASDAVGVGAASPETEGWVPRLGSLLGPDVRVVNLGVSGSTLAQALKEQ